MHVSIDNNSYAYKYAFSPHTYIYNNINIVQSCRQEYRHIRHSYIQLIRQWNIYLTNEQQVTLI
jgi:hypothetical protein